MKTQEVDLDVYVSIFLSTKGVDVGKKQLQPPEANRAILAGSGLLRLPVLCVPRAEVLGAYKGDETRRVSAFFYQIFSCH